jgi:hypothetical protein
MMFDMGLRRFRPMIDRLLTIAMREVGMVRRLFMLVRFIALRGFLMMVSGLLMMLRSFLVMVCCLFCHGPLQWIVRCSMPRRQSAVWSQLLRVEHIIWQTAGRCLCAKIQPEDGRLSKCLSVVHVKHVMSELSQLAQTIVKAEEEGIRLNHLAIKFDGATF